MMYHPGEQEAIGKAEEQAELLQNLSLLARQGARFRERIFEALDELEKGHVEHAQKILRQAVGYKK